jgi:rifampicin phosphotransferase
VSDRVEKSNHSCESAKRPAEHRRTGQSQGRANRLFYRCLILPALLIAGISPGANQPALTLGLPTLGAFSGASALNQKTDRRVRFLDRIDSRESFDRLARVLYQGRFGALPHVMFLIDRRDLDRVYYINSNLFKFHKDFANASYLSLERGRAFYENNYLKPERRFLMGTVANQTIIGKFSFEYWEGDLITADLLQETFRAIESSFYEPVLFKPNSTRQEEVARQLVTTNRGSSYKDLVISPTELFREQPYQPLNPGAAIGQLRVIDKVTPETVIDRNQIVIFKETPIQLTPLSGMIETEPTSPLSHVNMLARSWGIPNARIRDADKLFASLLGKYVRLEVRENDYSLEPAAVADVEARNRDWIKRSDMITPPSDLAYARLTDLRLQRKWDARRFGAKSANLGEVIHAHLRGIVVPPGFTIPFHYYRQFIRANDLEARISAAIEEDRFVHDPVYRRKRLADVRAWIMAGRLDGGFKRAVLEKVHREYAGRGLFVRSSTNSEDLPEFSGAGLYTTVPNVRTDGRLLEAITIVWASLWNYEAYEARESFGINHNAVYPGVLIQEGIDAESAGVAITTDPFNREDRGGVYINAKRGLGIKVVEGKRVAEQVVYEPVSRSIRVLTRSEEDTMLEFDEGGGVKEVAIPGERAVLTDAMIRRLADAALRIKQVFGGRDQDIEWLYRGGILYIVQSRPYVDGN